jgi:hypothetical protein
LCSARLVAIASALILTGWGVGSAPAQAQTIVTLGGGFNGPFGVAVEGSGNVFVANAFNFAVNEIPAGCIAGANDASCVKTLAAGSTSPRASRSMAAAMSLSAMAATTR